MKITDAPGNAFVRAAVEMADDFAIRGVEEWNLETVPIARPLKRDF